jgi:radical SAM-linked protein
MARTPDGPAPAPAVQRLRVHYAKRGRLRFASHRDFARAFERAVRRAEVPIAFSAGFSPHPKVSYANAAPTGVASEAEYLEIGVVERCDPERVRAALDASLPPGLDILEVVEAGPGSLADRLQASRWRVVLPGLSAQVVGDAVAAFLGREEVTVERLTKNGMRSFDARSAVLSAEVAEDEVPGAPGPAATPEAAPCAILHMVVRHATPAVRPDDVLEALHRVADLAPPVPVQVTRLAQGPHDGATGEIDDPLAPDRG